MTPESATTTDHDQIRRFVEALDSTPAVAGATGSDDDLRIRFRDESSDDLDAIGADKFFADGGTSRFPNFVKRR
jgi:hypothetical protein